MIYPNGGTPINTVVLVARAVDKCEGCRLSWRLRGWKHGEPMPIECRAQAERQELRDIAVRGKARVI